MTNFSDGSVFIIMLKSYLFHYFKKKPKRARKKERSQTKFLATKQTKKEPKSRNLAHFTPNWQL